MLNLLLFLVLLLLLIIVIYNISIKRDSYRIGGGDWVPERNDYTLTPCWQTGAGGQGAINSCERNSYTERTRLYNDYTVPDDNGNDKGFHYRRMSYVGWDTPVLTRDFCRGW